MRRAALRRRVQGDEGLSLVEVVVALGILSAVMLALLSSSVFAAKATVDARRNQQAADYLNQAIEQIRALDYADAVLLTSETAGDPAIVTVAGVQKFDPGSGLEDLASSTTGTVRPQAETVATTNGSYTTRRYVTIPAATPTTFQGLPSVRRVTVVVSWMTGSKTHIRRSSTLVTQTRRGLPLPLFTFKYNGPAPVVLGVPHKTKNPGNDLSYGFVINNLGARDAWTLSAGSVGWSFYSDTDKNGLWSGDVLTEPALTANSTGLIEPGTPPVYVVAHRVIGSSELGTSDTAFTATSEAITTVAKSVTTRLTVQVTAVAAPPPTTSTSPVGPCTPATAPAISTSAAPPNATTGGNYTLRTVYFYSPGGYQDTAELASNVMGHDSSPLTPRMCNWSTGLQTDQAGRLLAASTDTTASPVARTAEFRFQPPSSSEDQYRGMPVMSIWAQCPSGAPTLTVELLTLSGSTYTARSSVTMSTSGCSSTSFSRYSAILPERTFALGALTDSLVVRLTSSDPVRLGYGATDTPGSLTIGMK